MYLFVKVVSYEFLRPKEVANLQVKHLNLNEKTLRIDTKSRLDESKIILDVLMDDLKALVEKAKSPEDYLFTPTGQPGPWNTSPDNRRNYFSRQFKLKVKRPLELGREYGIYSFRHAFAVQLYKAFISRGMTSQEAKYKMLSITGHQSIKALENYLRDIGAELPEDYSGFLPEF